MKRLGLALAPFLALSGVALAQNTPAPAAQHAPVHPLAKMAANRGNENDASGGRATQALNLLGAKGYGHFTNFHADGKNYQASVTQGGTQFLVTVNPDTGAVTKLTRSAHGAFDRPVRVATIGVFRWRMP